MKYNAEIERQKQTAVAMMVCVLKRLLNDTVLTINSPLCNAFIRLNLDRKEQGNK